MSLIGKHCLSKIFQPIVNIPKSANVSHKDVTSKSQRVLKIEEHEHIPILFTNFNFVAHARTWHYTAS